MKIKYILLTILLIGSSCFADNLYKPINPSGNEIVFSTSAKNINSIDPTPQTNASGSTFPGGRGPNQLVIYTPAFGDRTNTNEFGTEAIVQGNVVTLLSGANSFIPQDGIVISGHGNAKVWMNQNITIGTKIYLDEQTNTLNTYTTSDSYLFEAEQKIDEVKEMIEYYENKLQNYDCTNSLEHIQAAQKYFKKAKKENKNQENIKKYAELAINEANQAINNVLPTIPNEVKGVWIRPTQTNEAQIIATLDNMQKLKINNIFLETYYHGLTIFPSNTMKGYGLTEQNKIFAGFNPLKIWITEAHKRNIKVHIWFQSFYVGNKYPTSNPTGILAIYPQWGNKTKASADIDFPTCSRSEHNGYFLDPANPEVQDFLTKLITEIILIYHPDGINLDYIRYPQAISKNESGNWGYTQYARADFKAMYGIDPIDLKRTDDLWTEWNTYRQEQITNFVRKIGNLGKQKHTYISTVIFPDIQSAINTKQQDWRTWSRRNYIDGFTPLFLTYDPKMVADMMQNVNSIKSPATDLYAGLFVTFMGGSKEDLVRQIHQTRKLNANGFILFDYAHSNNNKYTQIMLKDECKQQTTSAQPETSCNKKKWYQKLHN